jgi:hypothetical protein
MHFLKRVMKKHEFKIKDTVVYGYTEESKAMVRRAR